MTNKILLTIMLSASMALSVAAQESKPVKPSISVGSDFASQYLWRGFVFGKGPAVQPWGEVSYKGFTVGSWGNYELGGDFKEVDIYAKYTHKDMSLLFTDLFFPGYAGLNQHYFTFGNSTTGHCAELGLSYNYSGKFPLSFYAGVIMYGAAIDTRPADSIQVNHSTYIELKYNGNLNDLSYNFFIGITPGKSILYQTKGFNVIHIGAGAQKTIKVTESFSMPLKLTLSTNPVAEKIYLTLVLSL